MSGRARAALLLVGVIYASATDCDGSWNAWSECSASCGIGTQSRSFQVSGTGTDCKVPDNQTQNCFLQSCSPSPAPTFVSISPEVTDAWCQTVCKQDSDWKYPSACIESTISPLIQKCKVQDAAQQEKQTAVITPEGTVTQQFIPADIPKTLLKAVDCIGSWTQWGPCSESCGTGNQSRSFLISLPASPIGRRCAYVHGQTETQVCNTQVCVADAVPQQAAPQSVLAQTAKPCRAIAPEVTDWWCLKNCIPDSMGTLPPFCKSNPLTPYFQKCQCDALGERFGCWSTSPSVPDIWCSMVCTTMDDNGDVHAACKPGPFQECQCRFKSLPQDLRPPIPAAQQQAEQQKAAQSTGSQQQQQAPPAAPAQAAPAVLIPGQTGQTAQAQP